MMASTFEEPYIRLRRKEKRLYTDEQLALLPDSGPSDLYASEWAIRRASCNWLVRYLQKKQAPLTILEVGCGNGWLSNRLSGIPGAQVTGLDINRLELDQAMRVFSFKKNLAFLEADLRQLVPGQHLCDVIVFASSIQYFPFFASIIYTAQRFLKPGGEIHIIDSPFYAPEELEEARARTLSYFSGMGAAEMQEFYFHHGTDEWKRFDHTVLYNPRSLVDKWRKGKHPFYWLRIRKPK